MFNLNIYSLLSGRISIDVQTEQEEKTSFSVGNKAEDDAEKGQNPLNPSSDESA